MMGKEDKDEVVFAGKPWALGYSPRVWGKGRELARRGGLELANVGGGKKPPRRRRDFEGGGWSLSKKSYRDLEQVYCNSRWFNGELEGFNMEYTTVDRGGDILESITVRPVMPNGEVTFGMSHHWSLTTPRRRAGETGMAPLGLG
ncbi:hypothetical protein L211DRAFT_52665 [Terfezia boudieri ATCC MYA-4762]|uniref:Uncharacterized protein n=1 Tax=Terfezia boudieri ATCC MYA-4762 TaxID=1051890 RepID=A0A3N4M925_9PEZI|nr:hypothetical protein L211DRAFT_52665 [Terfezia boudieri ATCC MYA-4762]